MNERDETEEKENTDGEAAAATCTWKLNSSLFVFLSYRVYELYQFH